MQKMCTTSSGTVNSEQLKAVRELVKDKVCFMVCGPSTIVHGYRVAVSEELIVIVVNPLKVLMLAGAPLHGLMAS